MGDDELAEGVQNLLIHAGGYVGVINLLDKVGQDFARSLEFWRESIFWMFKITLRLGWNVI